MSDFIFWNKRAIVVNLEMCHLNLDHIYIYIFSDNAYSNHVFTLCIRVCVYVYIYITPKVM